MFKSLMSFFRRSKPIEAAPQVSRIRPYLLIASGSFLVGKGTVDWIQCYSAYNQALKEAQKELHGNKKYIEYYIIDLRNWTHMSNFYLLIGQVTLPHRGTTDWVQCYSTWDEAYKEAIAVDEDGVELYYSYSIVDLRDWTGP